MNEMVMEEASGPTVGARIRRFAALLVPSLGDIRSFEPVLPPVAVGWTFSLVAAFASRPLIVEALRSQQPGTAAAMDAMLTLAALAAPLIMLVRAGLLTALGWAVLVLADATRRVKLIFSVLLYGEAILMFQGVATALWVHATAGGDVTSVQELRIPLGLTAWVDASRPVLWALAQNATVFHLAWVVFVAAAMRFSAGFGRAAAVALALFFWGIVLTFAAARTFIAI